MSKIYFTKLIELNIKDEFNIETYNFLKSEYNRLYNENENWFFIRDYESILNIKNLKNEGYNQDIVFSKIYFDKSRYNFDDPIEMKRKYLEKPNFDDIPFIAESVVYDVVESGIDFYDLVFNNTRIKLSTAKIKNNRFVIQTP